MTDSNSILFFISNDDASKIAKLKVMGKWFLLECYFELLKKNLNGLYSIISTLEYIKANK